MFVVFVTNENIWNWNRKFVNTIFKTWKKVTRFTGRDIQNCEHSTQTKVKNT